jgi:hypothetical protein
VCSPIPFFKVGIVSLQIGLQIGRYRDNIGDNQYGENYNIGNKQFLFCHVFQNNEKFIIVSVVLWFALVMPELLPELPRDQRDLRRD